MHGIEPPSKLTSCLRLQLVAAVAAFGPSLTIFVVLDDASGRWKFFKIHRWLVGPSRFPTFPG